MPHRCMASLTTTGTYVSDEKTRKQPDRCTEDAYRVVGDDELEVWLCAEHYAQLMKRISLA